MKGDIVEALQCVKCAIRNDLLFWEQAPSSALEAELEAGGFDEEDGNSDDSGSERLVIDDNDNDNDGLDPMSDVE